jgi:hypothetical protein
VRVAAGPVPAAAQRGVCAASLMFFLATQAQIRTRLSAANLGAMRAVLSSFLMSTAR